MAAGRREALTEQRKLVLSRSPAVLEQLRLVDLVADSNATVLICGETGTGKELVAQRLHSCSRRADAPFIAVNCAAVPEALQESVFFGHTRGSFTGATQSKTGLFEAANEGTVFLDEISETSPVLQAKLLRVLQSGEYMPVGSTKARFSDTRVVAAANRDLLEMIDNGQFRDDLYYRLNVFQVELPPLRDRLCDVQPLAEYFLSELCYDGVCGSFDGSAMEALKHYRYPGNVRELKNIVQYAVLVARDGYITEADLPRCVTQPQASSRTLPDNFHEAKARVVEDFERRFISEALDQSGGIVRRAARCTGLSERNFHAKLRRYGIFSKHYRAG